MPVPGIKDISEAILYVLGDFGHADRVRRVGVFGSVARGEPTADSDIDFVIDYKYAICGAPDDAILEAKKWFELE